MGITFSDELDQDLAAEVVHELGAALRLRGVELREGRMPRMVELAASPTGPILIQVRCTDDPNAREIDPLVFDGSELPEGTLGLSLARAIGDILVHAAVIPTVPASDGASPASDPSFREGAPPPPPSHRVGFASAPVAEPAALDAEEPARTGSRLVQPPEPPSAAGPSVSCRLILAASGAIMTTEDTQLAGRLGIACAWSWLTIELDARAGAGLTRSGPTGAVQPSLFGGDLAVLARAAGDDHWAFMAGPLVTVAAVRFDATASSPSVVPDDAVGPVVFVGARAAIRFVPSPWLGVSISVDAQGVALGAEGRDDTAAVSRVDGAVIASALGVEVAL